MTSLTTSVPLIIQREAAKRETFWRAALLLICFWNERARQRAALADLDEHMLRDIGLTKFDVKRECEKMPWQ